MLSGGNGNLAVAVRLMRLAQFIQSDLASIPVSARSGVFSEEISERFQILAESEGFKIFSKNLRKDCLFSSETVILPLRWLLVTDNRPDRHDYKLTLNKTACCTERISV